MSPIGQPSDYSQILLRIFICTVAVGLVCTVIFAWAYPPFHQFILTFGGNTNIAWVEDLKLLYVVIPVVFAVLARAVYLHDKISDLLGLRRRFDTEHILFPIAASVGVRLTKQSKDRLTVLRKKAMYKVFYRYAGFGSPKIDTQLVQSALDLWGWFWSALIAALICIVTAIALLSVRAWLYAALVTGAVLILGCFMFFQWKACCRAAAYEVEAILDDAQRRKAIRKELLSLLA